MRLVFLWASGARKGTQAELIASLFPQPKIATGDILRELVRHKTALGLHAKACLDQGKLVPDAVVVGIVKEKLAEPMCAKGFLLDGFPRTIRQAEDLAELLRSRGERLDRVVNFVVPRDELVRRLTGRRSCSKCQAVFHVELTPPRHAGICDRCGGELGQRSDDKKETAEARRSAHAQPTAPLGAYYRQRD